MEEMIPFNRGLKTRHSAWRVFKRNTEAKPRDQVTGFDPLGITNSHSPSFPVRVIFR